MQCLKDVLEIIYYIAFIILTVLIVKYAKQTYDMQSEKKYKLLCKLFFDRKSVEKSSFSFFLEVYNYGNVVSENIEIFVGEKRITTIDFVKPNESYYFPLDMQPLYLSYIHHQISTQDTASQSNKEHHTTNYNSDYNQK